MSKLLACVSLLALASCATAPGGSCQLVRVADLPIEIRNGTILIDAVLNGAPARLQFDTGSTTSVLTRAAVRRLRLRSLAYRVGDVIGIGGHRSAGVVVADRFQLGQLHGEQFNFLASDVFGDATNAPDGLLSTDFLSKYDIDLDLADRKIILFLPLHDCGSQTAVALDPPVYTVGLIPAATYDGFGERPAFDLHSPRVIAQIDGRDVKAAIDTGALYTLIFRNEAARHGIDIDTLLTGAKPALKGVGPNAVRAVGYVLPQISIGDIAVRNVRVVIADQRDTDDVDMLLGLEFMSRVHVWISNSSRTLAMQYPPKPSPP